MTGSIPPPGPLSYEGQIVVPFIQRNFPPTTAFNKFPVPTIWIDPEHTNAYILVAKPAGVADWILIGGGTGTLQTITTPDGTVVTPVGANINFLNGSAMNITGSGNNITFNAVGMGLQWIDVTGTSQTAAVNHGYVSDNGSLVTITLPTTAAFGDVIGVVGRGAGGWTIAQNVGQQIICGTLSSTMGVGGSVASTNARDSIFLLCTSANTEFTRLAFSGNLTIT